MTDPCGPVPIDEHSPSNPECDYAPELRTAPPHDPSFCGTCAQGETHHQPIGGDDDPWCFYCEAPWSECPEAVR